jgi:hypothetical protein
VPKSSAVLYPPVADPTFARHHSLATRPSPTRSNGRTRERARHKPAVAQTEYTNLQAPKTIEPSANKFEKTPVKKGDESSRTLAMAGEAGGEPRAWLAVEETAATFISRSLSSRPPIILPPPLHRAPLRPGNVVEIAGPSNSGKSHLLLMVRQAPFWSRK